MHLESNINKDEQKMERRVRGGGTGTATTGKRRVKRAPTNYA